jgi:SHS2 domain-containing protein
MRADYKILEHPSDLGIEARGASLAEAFQNAAQGLMSIILDLSSVEPSEERELAINSSDLDQLLVNWLSEILYLYDGQRFICRDFIIQKLTPTGLKAKVRGEIFSENTHRTKLDVKAVTYHQLFVQENKNGGLVRVYLDI